MVGMKNESKYRVAKGFAVTRDETQIISVMHDLGQISLVRCV